MKRGHTALEYKSKIRKLKKIRPNISMSSDFIIGFPGETDADFEATMDLIQAVDYDLSFSFIYSARPGTPAADYSQSAEQRDQVHGYRQRQPPSPNQGSTARPAHAQIRGH